MIAIIGLGYVGLPLCLQFAKSGNSVVGLDIDPAKVDCIRKGESYIHHIEASSIRTQVGAGLLQADTDFSRIAQCDDVIICVPTPLNKNREPDLSYVLKTGESIAPHLKAGTLVVLESTTYPGTTDTELRTVLESGSGLVAGEDFHLAFSPEREDPGNPDSNVSKIPKVIGGLTAACARRAESLYLQAVEKVVPVNSCRAAEATKLLENIFRSVNIALVNELKIVYESMGIDVWEVIEAAKTKPFGYMPFYPGPGLGGHCIPIDPFYLTWKAREYGQSTRFIELAGEINTAMPKYVIEKLVQGLNQFCKPVRGSKILIAGLAYKANVDDDRESPAYILMDHIERLGGEVEYFDPFVPVIRPSREHSHRAGMKSVSFDESSLRSFDATIIATAHSNVDYQKLVDWSHLVIDTRNATKSVRSTTAIIRG